MLYRLIEIIDLKINKTCINRLIKIEKNHQNKKKKILPINSKNE